MPLCTLFLHCFRLSLSHSFRRRLTRIIIISNCVICRKAGRIKVKSQLDFTAGILWRYNSRHGFQSALSEVVEKYPSTVGFEPGILALTASALTTFAKMTDTRKPVYTACFGSVLIFLLLQSYFASEESDSTLVYVEKIWSHPSERRQQGWCI